MHTPGPWKLSRDGQTIFASTEGAGVTIRGVEQTIPQIAYIARNGFAATLDEQASNSQVIVAAPDLLAICKSIAMVHGLKDCIGAVRWNQLADAINKADGK